jgi:cysteine desulfurase
MNRPVYLDYNATTPIDPAVVEAMLPYLHDRYGNASSSHVYGVEAHRAIETARAQVAALIGASPDEILFTGGGSETDNLALKGFAFAHLDERPRFLSCTIEHPAILSTLRYLTTRFGLPHTLIEVDRFGCVDLDSLRSAMSTGAVLITVMHANNEVGTIEPIEEIAAIAAAAGALVHTDAAQSAGKLPIDVRALNVDLLTIAGHKLYGPKGIGVLYVRRGTKLDPLVHGSGQELGMRAGTENVASIVGLGKAAELAAADQAEEALRLCTLRDALHHGLATHIPGLVLNGHPEQRLPNTLNVSAPGVPGFAWLGIAAGVAASTGSACHSGSPDPSPVLTAMGLPAERAAGAIRLSLGRWTTTEDITIAINELATAYTALACPGSPP